MFEYYLKTYGGLAAILLSFGLLVTSDKKQATKRARATAKARRARARNAKGKTVKRSTSTRKSAKNKVISAAEYKRIMAKSPK